MHYLTERGQPPAVRVLMLVLGVPNLVAGCWALMSPRGWFDEFPGWAPSLVAAYPPYNEHLTVDAGSGLFASGLVMTVAALWPRREVVVVASIAFLAFAVPHAAWHWLHPSDDLSATEDVVSTASLVLAVVGGAVVLLVQWRLTLVDDGEPDRALRP